MPYLEFLKRLHAALRPATYLEIGIRAGDSLALSRSRSIGIDPDFNVKCPITCDVSLFRTTSDDYFARPETLAPFHGAPADLAFIDGLHLFEFALRDFVSVEHHVSPSSLVVLDDIFPRTIVEAARDRHTRMWTGVPCKIFEVL